MDNCDTQVLIVGGGPVGMTLALDLAQRGVAVTIVEQRSGDDPAAAKCNTVAARTMEIFRRLGIADAVRDAGLDPDFPTDVIYATRLTGYELCRLELPSRNSRYGPDGRPAPGYADSHWLTPEPNHRISQIYLEAVLAAHVEKEPGITLLRETVAQDYLDDGEVVTLRCRRNGKDFSLTAPYLIGCDGGRSRIRKQMGVRLEGDALISRTRSTLIRAPDLLDRFGTRPAWMTWVVNSEINGAVIAIDGRELWLVHRHLAPEMTSFDELDADWSLRRILGVDDDFEYEVVHHEDWTGRRLVAETFRRGQVFISGDAAHLWVPWAGYGMNAGIADATNLSWMLAAVLEGWARPSLLDAHDAERQPITQQVSRYVMDLALADMKKAASKAVPERLEAASADGEAARARMGQALMALNRPQFVCEGLNFGYFYEASPVIAYDGESPPKYSMGEATPSTVPGCRLPHFWLPDGSSLYDHLGNGFTLLRFEPSADWAGLRDAAAARRVPLELLDVQRPAEPAVFGEKLLLVRPDQHIAWRGDRAPANPLDVIDLVRGAAMPAGHSRVHRDSIASA